MRNKYIFRIVLNWILKRQEKLRFYERYIEIYFCTHLFFEKRFKMGKKAKYRIFEKSGMQKMD